MTGREKTVPTANNWADEIDDLNREAMKRHLEAISFMRALGVVVKAEVADNQSSSSKSGQNELSAGGVQR